MHDFVLSSPAESSFLERSIIQFIGLGIIGGDWTVFTISSYSLREVRKKGVVYPDPVLTRF